MMCLLLLWLYLDQGIMAQNGRFDKPLILAKPSSMVAPGTNVTLHCWMMESTLQEVTFTLWMVGRLANAQKQAEREAKFSLPSVSLDNAGSYICAYSEKGEPKRMSEASDILDLVVTGSFPKPSFLAHPSPNVVLGEHVVLRCTLPLPRLPDQTLPDGPARLQRFSGTECDVTLSGVSLRHQLRSVQGGRGDACWDRRLHPGRG
uniref:Killer cell immunoglobulin-like receptor 2DS3 n=1 Tax=Phascolarctos cinereus TaxID=38626 RepID=A0A6P5LRP2_PHACI|nr:killer cell immunoglobulin-like receptor 2DS3 [Phascolarctos cinereus]